MSALRLQLPRLLLRGQHRTASIVNARFYQSSIQSTVLSKYQEKLNKKLQTYSTLCHFLHPDLAAPSARQFPLPFLPPPLALRRRVIERLLTSL